MYLAKESGRNQSVGVLPRFPYAETGGRGGDWWEKPLTDADTAALLLIRSGGPVLVEA